MKKITVFIGALSFMISSFGQDIKVPVNTQFKKVIDYETYKDSMVMVANWMMNSPITKDREKRDAANKFVLSWISGISSTHFNVRQDFKNEITKDKSNFYSTDLFMDYIAGMVLFKINNDRADEFETQEAGIKALMQGYESVENFCTVKFIEMLNKQEKIGKLSEWIKANAVKSEPKDKTE